MGGTVAAPAPATEKIPEHAGEKESRPLLTLKLPTFKPSTPEKKPEKRIASREDYERVRCLNDRIATLLPPVQRQNPGSPPDPTEVFRLL